MRQDVPVYEVAVRQVGRQLTRLTVSSISTPTGEYAFAMSSQESVDPVEVANLLLATAQRLLEYSGEEQAALVVKQTRSSVSNVLSFPF